MAGSIGFRAAAEVTWIVRTLMEARENIDGISVYLFGSVLISRYPQSDIDLLVIYRRTSSLKQCQILLKELGREIPLDVIYMEEKEEEELAFIERQNCQKVFPPN